MTTPLRLVSPVSDTRPMLPGPPLHRLEAEVMLAVAAYMRSRALALPAASELRGEWLLAADDMRTAAELTWPSIRSDRAAWAGIHAVGMGDSEVGGPTGDEA